MSFRPEAATKPTGRRWTRLLALALLVPAALLAAGGDHEARDRAEALAAQQDWRAARVEYLNALKQDPADAAALRGQAAVLLRLGDGAGAAASLDRIVSLGGSAQSLAELRAEALILQYRAAEALDLLRPLPPSANVDRLLGQAATAVGDTETAQAAFDRALSRPQQSAPLWLAVARFRQSIGDDAGAGAAADRAVRIDPRDVRALTLRGLLVRRQFGLLPALDWFNRALEIDPDDVEALLEQGATLGDLGRHVEMLAAARHVLSIDPANDQAMFQQAVIAARAGDCLLARRLLERTGDMIDRVPAAMQLSGACELQDGNARAAADRLAALLEMQPRNLRVRLLLALALHRAGDQPGALDAIRPISDQVGAGSYAVTLHARILEAMGQQAEAMELLNRAARPAPPVPILLNDAADIGSLENAAETSPLSAPAVLPWLRALLANGRAADGVEAARRLAEVNRGNADAQIVLGDMLAAADDRAGSWRAYVDARRIGASGPLLPRLLAFMAAPDAGALIAQWQAVDPTDVASAEASFWAEALAEGPAAQDAGTYLVARGGYNQPAVLAQLATLQAETDPAEALASARAAVRAQPLNPAANRAMGVALLAVDRRRDARQWLLKARALMPSDSETRRLLARTG